MTDFLRDLFILIYDYPWVSFFFSMFVIMVLQILVELLKTQLQLINQRNKLLCEKKTSTPSKD